MDYNEIERKFQEQKRREFNDYVNRVSGYFIHLKEAGILVIQVQTRVYGDLPWVVFRIPLGLRPQGVSNTTWGKSPCTLVLSWIKNLFPM